PLRILDEGEFWKHQESEHTEVIRALVTNLEAEYVRALLDWEQALSQTHAVFTRYIETVVRIDHPLDAALLTKIEELIVFSLHQSEQFILLLNQLGTESGALRSNPTALVVLAHIRRESEYFIGITLALLTRGSGKQPALDK
ncbi:MAG: hypothetical protein JWN30_547, partial [Bacilli bacterium]|nr:hypothetical protein [Bacilli bacterium]